jgi:type II secretory pathway component GspD/PulD (secretin)
MRPKNVGLCLVFALTLISTAPAQGPDTIVGQINVKNVDVVTVLDQLLMSNERSFLVYPHVSGKVTLDLKNVRLPSVLQNLATQVDASVFYRNGIYELRPRSEPPRPAEPEIPIITAVYLEKTPLIHALKAVFGSGSVSYTTDPNVPLDSTVTLALKNQELETVLRNILNQVDCTYRIEGGIFQIIRRESPVISDPHPDLRSMALTNTPIRVALRALGIPFTADPTLQGNVTLVAENKTVERILQELLAQVDGSYRVEGGIYHFFAKAKSRVAEAQPTMIVDGKYIYILRGNQLIKVDKETMKVVGTSELPPRR